jgi:hypothetical protein
VVSEHPEKGVTQEAMSVARAPWNSWRPKNLSIEPELSRANLSEANLVRADLCRAELPATKLSEADLSRADLSEADLSEAILAGATLSGADLSTASLTQEELEPATGDENTRLPPDLNPPAHWGVKTDEQVSREDRVPEGQRLHRGITRKGILPQKRM